MKRAVLISLLLSLTGIIIPQAVYESLLKARAFIDNGKPAEAISVLDFSGSDLRDARINLLRGEAYMMTGNMPEAEKEYAAAGNILPSSGDYGLARIHSLGRNVARALYHLELHMKSPFRKSEKEILLDPAFSVIENTPEWRLFWKKEWYSAAESALSEVEYYISIGRREEAQRISAELSGRYPGDDISNYARAYVSYGLGRYQEAVTVLAKLISGDRNNTSFLSLLARSEEASGNPAGASATYSRLIELEFADPSVYLKRAGCYRQTREYDKASKDLEKFISWYPESRDAIRLAGKIESERGNNLKAIEFFSRNVRQNPGDPECFVDRAGSYFIARSWEYAATDYSMALDINPQNPEVWLNKGISLLNMGKTEDACHDFRRALSQGNRKAASYISSNCIK